MERIMNKDIDTKPQSRVQRAGRRTQQGVVLFIALIALVALSLAGLAFMRSVDTGGMIAGNLAFSRAAVAYSDIGMEQARNQVIALAALNTCGPPPSSSPCLNYDQPTAATPFYYSNWQPAWDYRTFSWTDANSGTIASPVSGYQIRFVVHRLCAPGVTDVSNLCVTDPQAPTIGGGVSLGSVDYSNYVKAASAGAAIAPPYYRITIRVQGPRNSVVYTQAWMV
jgi:hypothetical protein